VVCGWLVAQGTTLDNLDFSAGTLSGWSGQGFAVLAKDVKKNQVTAVSSRDTGAEGRTGVLHRSILVPADADVIRCTACAVLAKGCTAHGLLDIVLLTANNKVLPKEVHTTTGWQKVAHLLAGQESEPAEYLWRVAAYAGQTLRIVLVDQDIRPGCSIC